MRKIILYLVIIFQVLLIISLLRGIQLSRRSALRIADMQEKKMKLEEERMTLNEERKYFESAYYLEKVARDELHLSKPGETVVIVPVDNKIENYADSSQILRQNKKNLPNWVKWIEILSGKIE